jgi:glycerol-3-phosphate dehydrogenase
MILSDAPHFDLIVIGAGINGAAIAREAALRELRVLVLEQSDVGSATSAASTRLIHGGLRYLEHAELGLVRESLRERERLLRLAPHLVAPLKLYVPIFTSSRRRKWQLRVGMALYDLLSLDKSLPRHVMLNRDQMIAALPSLKSRDLVGGAYYYDAQIEYPERLIVELLQDAVAHGTTLLSYAHVESIVIVERRARGVEYRSRDGQRAVATADAIVNATGPWVDELVGGISNKRLIGGTRGSHLIALPFTGAPDAALYTEAASDGRPFFIIPWNGLYLIGTTDVRFDGNPGQVTIDGDERDYLLEETRLVIPGAHDLTERLCYAHAGVRPLPHHAHGEEAAITRRHLIRHHRGATGLYSIIGGKLTTHRALAEDVLARLRRRLPAWPRHSVTRERPLPGAIAGAERDSLARELGAVFEVRHVDRLLRTYGANARELLAATRAQPEIAQALAPKSSVVAAELVHAVGREWATNLSDILLRRCMVGLNSQRGLDEVEAAARWLVDLGLAGQRKPTELIDEYRAHVRRFEIPPAAPESGEA